MTAVLPQFPRTGVNDLVFITILIDYSVDGMLCILRIYTVLVHSNITLAMMRFLHFYTLNIFIV